jgi:hypothetical protein
MNDFYFSQKDIHNLTGQEKYYKFPIKSHGFYVILYILLILSYILIFISTLITFKTKDAPLQGPYPVVLSYKKCFKKSLINVIKRIFSIFIMNFVSKQDLKAKKMYYGLMLSYYFSFFLFKVVLLYRIINALTYKVFFHNKLLFFLNLFEILLIRILFSIILYSMHFICFQKLINWNMVSVKYFLLNYFISAKTPEKIEPAPSKKIKPPRPGPPPGSLPGSPPGSLPGSLDLSPEEI